MVDEVITEFPFNAEQTIVGGTICGFNTDYLAALHEQVHLATDAAVGTGCRGFRDFPGTKLLFGLGHEGSRRTDGNTVAAGNTGRFGDHFFKRSCRMGSETPVGEVDCLGTLLGDAGIDATAAVGALIGVADIKLIGFVKRGSCSSTRHRGFP